MYKYFLSLLLLSFNVMADPFFGEQQALENEYILETDIAKNAENIPACKPSENGFSLNLTTEFEKLKLIGLVKINHQFRALFIDDKNQLFDLKENELINDHQIEIKNINLRSITYINWKLTNDCSSPYEVILKL
ncbi:hypothetical protein PTQ27_11350 [Mannheimia sp. AT1]|uniref:Pilus assembly protein PilP n=1 Tax=Mannheimia cairinae TaxID=3025936 RepID=A0ABT5MS91_9PAST|nr:hypothetical protein [Mannheimia cairinae]MDD0825049.1 hypothetical protein [Mannheimia cairinae]MDD0825696.1 hypothetical protein [Mannheimia cairinae]